MRARTEFPYYNTPYSDFAGPGRTGAAKPLPAGPEPAGRHHP